MSLFWAFAILLIFVFLFVIAVRRRFMAWGWNFAMIAIILYAGLFKMTGTPRDAFLFSSIEQVHGDVNVVWQKTVPHKFINLLVSNNPGEAPYYLQLPWSPWLDQELQKATMDAQASGREVHANADALSQWMIDSIGGEKTKEGKPGDGEAAGKKMERGNRKGSNGYNDKEYNPNVFYPKPVPPDPNKNYRTTIEGTPSEPMPDARQMLGPD